MIGQNKLKEKIKVLKKLPPLLILTGERGAGKHTAVDFIADVFSMPIFEFGAGIDDVRKALDVSYRIGFDCIYVCYDAERMSNQAKNSLLKVLEEPPENAHFIITLTDISETLKTIQSRAWHIALDSYTNKELDLIAKENGMDNVPSHFFDLVRLPSAILALKNLDMDLFFDDVNSFLDNAVAGNFGHCFGLIKKLKIKEDDEDILKYDPILFLTALKQAVNLKEKLPAVRKYMAINLITKVISNFKTALNKQIMLEALVVGLGKK